MKKRAKSIASLSCSKGLQAVLREAEHLSSGMWSDTHRKLYQKLTELQRKRKLEGQVEGQLLLTEKVPMHWC